METYIVSLQFPLSYVFFLVVQNYHSVMTTHILLCPPFQNVDVVMGFSHGSTLKDETAIHTPQ
jgi:hypothetical protein